MAGKQEAKREPPPPNSNRTPQPSGPGLESDLPSGGVTGGPTTGSQGASFTSARFPDRVIIMPDEDKYHVVNKETLERLGESRMSWALEGLLCALGLIFGSLTGAVVGLSNWPLDVDGFISTILTVSGIVASSIFGFVWWRRRKNFGDIMDQIQRGPAYQLRNPEIEAVRPKDGK